jgi:propanol-preferring alcohol dehydrogenase
MHAMVLKKLGTPLEWTELPEANSGFDEMPPEQLDAAIIFATAGDLVPLALKAVRKGGRVVCAGIHMSDIPGFPYQLLDANQALADLRAGRFEGAAVLVP